MSTTPSEEAMERARAEVATWPPVTDEQCREITRINLAHRRRKREEAKRDE